MILNSPMNMKHSNCAVYTDPFGYFSICGKLFSSDTPNMSSSHSIFMGTTVQNLIFLTNF